MEEKLPINVTIVFSSKDAKEYKHLLELSKKHKLGASAAMRMALDYHRQVSKIVGETVEVFKDRLERNDNPV